MPHMGSPDAGPPEVGPPEVGRQPRALGLAFAAVSAGSFAQASFQFMLVPLQSEIPQSVDSLTGLTLIPAAAGLLIVFIAGSLGDRLGVRRLLVTGAFLYIAGALLVMIAMSAVPLFAGRALGGIGSVVLGVAGLAAIAQGAQGEHRARDFGYIAAVIPASYLVSSLVSAFMLSFFPWRALPITWVLLASAVLIPALRARHLDAVAGARSELLTPLLAGVALASAGVGASTVTNDSRFAAIAFAISAFTLVVLVVIMRMGTTHTLDLRLLRAPGGSLTALALIAATATNVFFFVSLFMQYRFPDSTNLLPALFCFPQAAGVAGGVVGGWLSARWGASRSAMVLLAATAVMSLSFLLVAPMSSLWLPLLLLSAFALPAAAAMGPLTQCFMDCAPSDGTAAGSALRSATSSLGSIFGSVVGGAIIFTVFTNSITVQLKDWGMAEAFADAISWQLRAGAFASELAEEVSAVHPDLTGTLVGDAYELHSAQVDALHAMGLLGLVTYSMALVLMYLALRRSARSSKQGPKNSVGRVGLEPTT